MNSFSCIIVDDEQNAINLLQDTLVSIYPNINIQGTCTQWNMALELLRTTQPDILFLDISMQGKNGITLVKSLPGLKCEVIFITAHSEYALEAFKVFASGYILKPFDEIELTVTIDKALEKRKNKQHTNQSGLQDKIGIPGNHAIEYINQTEILYLASVNAYTKVVTTSQSILSSYILGKFKAILNEELFYQVHRSYIVNLNYIKRYETNGTIVMTDGTEIPVSKTAKEPFLALFKRVNNNF